MLEQVRQKWMPIDAVMAGYTAWMGLLIAWFSADVPEWPRLVAIHAVLLAAIVIMPSRGASWETKVWPRVWQRTLHEFIRFVRYAYPLALALFFFEEGQYTVNMIFPDTPYWFEPRLYAADIAAFGDHPVRLMNSWVTPWLTELMNFFYFSYYLILVGGVALAYVGFRGRQEHFRVPAPGFHEVIGSLGTAFVAAFVFYPWLASRGPWENPELMAELTPMNGWVFTWAMEGIISHGAVSGNCFPSGHVAGAWAVVFGLAWTKGHRRSVYLLAALSAGMTLACVYLRYHHVMDMPAGLGCAVIGGIVGGGLAHRWTQARQNSVEAQSLAAC